MGSHNLGRSHVPQIPAEGHSLTRNPFMFRWDTFNDVCKMLGFMVPLCPQIHATSLTELAYCVCFWGYHTSPLSADII